MSDAILLLGAGGFVGSKLLTALAARGQHVIAVSRSAFEAPDTVQCHVGELCEPSDFAELLPRCRVVVHAASASTPGSTAMCPVSELEENLRPTLALLEALQDFPAIHLIYLSSGGTLYGETATCAADECAPTVPRSYHGAGKLSAEAFINAWCCQYRAVATILRPSNLYGPGQVGRVGFGIVPAAFEKMAHRGVLRVWGDGSARRDYLYIGDFVDLCLAVLDAGPPAAPRIVNACNGESVTLDELFATMQHVTGNTLERVYDASRLVDVPNVSMRPDLARKLYGWTATTKLEEGLQCTWEWFNTITR